MLISLKRVIRNGYRNFSRNLALNSAAVFIMSIVVFLITMLFIFNLASKILLSSVQEKVDISIYFKTDVSVEDILEIKSNIAKIPEVKEVEYVSKEQALEKFIEKHKEDPIIMESLTEIGENPLIASLAVKAHNAFQYGEIAKFLEDNLYKDLVDRVDYYQRKPVIEKIFNITSGINQGGILFSIVLGAIAFLIGFNTLRIAIHNCSEEVSIMRLVGASNWFIRGPFLIQGIIVGVLSALFAFLTVFLVSFAIDLKIKMIAPDISFFNLFLSNFWMIVLIQLIIGIGLGIISTMAAIRKCLKV